MASKNAGVSKRSDSVPAHIRRHLLSQPKSGLSIPAYSKRHSFSAWSFYQWRKRYQNALTPQYVPPMASFTEIGILQPAGKMCDIRFPSGVTVTVNRGISGEDIAPLLKLLMPGTPC